MKTIQTTIKLLEPSDIEAMPDDSKFKQQFLSKYRYINVDDYRWFDFIEEDMKEKLNQLGYFDINAGFSGFWCQGDGANIKCKIYGKKAINLFGHHTNDKDKIISDAIDNDDIELDAIIVRKNGYRQYEHEYCLTSHCETDYEYQILPEEFDTKENQEYLNDLMTYLQKQTLEMIQKESRTYYKNLEKEYDSQTSDEAIFRFFKDYDHLFLQNGNIFESDLFELAA